MEVLMPGGIARMVRWLDGQNAAFAVARLIMMTGIKVRSFDDQSADDPATMKKLEASLRVVLAPNDLEAALKQLHGR
jgi:hypothetical protein